MKKIALPATFTAISLALAIFFDLDESTTLSQGILLCFLSGGLLGFWTVRLFCAIRRAR